MKKIKSVDLQFENCEVASIPMGDIYAFGISGVKKCYHSCNDKEMNERNYSEDFWMVFENLRSLTFVGFKDGPEKSLYERLKYSPDITHIDIIYEDCSNDYIGVPWGSKSHFFNAFQNLILHKYPSGSKHYIIEINNKWSFKKIIKFSRYVYRTIYWKVICKLTNRSTLRGW